MLHLVAGLGNVSTRNSLKLVKYMDTRIWIEQQFWTLVRDSD